MRHELDRLHIVIRASEQGTVAQCTATSPGQKTILTALDAGEPPRVFAAVECSTTPVPYQLRQRGPTRVVLRQIRALLGGSAP